MAPALRLRAGKTLGSPPAITLIRGTHIGGHRAQPAPRGCHPGRTSAGCVRTGQPGRTPLFHLRARKAAAARGETAAPGPSPTPRVPGERRGAAGTRGTWTAAPRPPLWPHVAPLAEPRGPRDVLFGSASCEELPVAGKRGGMQTELSAPEGFLLQRWAPGIPPASGLHPAQELLVVLLVLAVPRLSGTRGWRQSGRGGHQPHRTWWLLCPTTGGQGCCRGEQRRARTPSCWKRDGGFC